MPQTALPTELECESHRCPETRDLMAFNQGRLPESLIVSIEQHLNECELCVDTLGAFEPADPLGQLACRVLSENGKSEDRGHQQDSEIERQLRQQLKQLAELPKVELILSSIRHADRFQIREIESHFDPIGESTPGGSTSGEGPSQRPSDPSATTSIGQVANYRIERLLGCGSSGIVYRAFDLDLKRPVAIKFLRPTLGEQANARFVREARATAAIKDPHVVAIYHVGTWKSLSFIAMEWTPGETLQQRLDREAVLPATDAMRMARQVAQGLRVAHQQGIIHRDIKPANLWIDKASGLVKILDLGMVRVMDTDLQLTCTGLIAGTPCYMSPEQARGAAIDFRSDFFSLGCVLFQAIAGRLPFHEDNLLATIQAIQIDAPPKLNSLDPMLPKVLAELVDRLLSKAAADRPPTAQAIIDAIDQAMVQDSGLVGVAGERQFIPQTDSTNDDSSQVVSHSRPSRFGPNQPPIHKAGQASGNLFNRSWSSLLSNPLRWVIPIAMLFSVGGLALGAPQIIRILTDQGQLVIESDDQDVKIEVTDSGGSVRIIDLKTEQSIDIKSGLYSLQLSGKSNHVEINRDTLRMTRGGKQIVKVTRRTNRTERVGERSAATSPLERRSQASSIASKTITTVDASGTDLLSEKQDLPRIGTIPLKTLDDLLQQSSRKRAALIAEFRRERVQLLRNNLASVTLTRKMYHHIVPSRSLRYRQARGYEGISRMMAGNYETMTPDQLPEKLEQELTWLKSFNRRQEKTLTATWQDWMGVALGRFEFDRLTRQKPSHESERGEGNTAQLLPVLETALRNLAYRFDLTEEGVFSFSWQRRGFFVSGLDRKMVDLAFYRVRLHANRLKLADRGPNPMAGESDIASSELAELKHQESALIYQIQKCQLEIEQIDLAQQVQDLEANRVKTEIADSGSTDAQVPLVPQIATPAVSITDSNVALAEQFDLVGYCLNDNGIPMPDAQVRLYRLTKAQGEPQLIQQVSVGAKGEFRIGGLQCIKEASGESYSLRAVSEGLELAEVSLDHTSLLRKVVVNSPAPSGQPPITAITSGKLYAFVELTLPIKAIVLGSIKDNAGQPVDRMKVSRKPTSPDSVGIITHSDSSGRFRLADTLVATDRRGKRAMELRLQHPTYGDYTLMIDHWSPGAEISVELPKLVKISGRLMAADTRAPLAEMHVRVERQASRDRDVGAENLFREHVAATFGMNHSLVLPEHQSSVSNADGTFEFLVPQGFRYSIQAWDEEFNYTFAKLVDLIHEPNDRINIQATLQRTIEIKGRVVDQQGLPMGNQEVIWWGPDRPSSSSMPRQTVADQEGNFVAKVAKGMNYFELPNASIHQYRTRWKETWTEHYSQETDAEVEPRLLVRRPFEIEISAIADKVE